MISISRKHGIILAFIAVIIIAIITWVIVSRQNIDKIPLRGVFV